MDWGEILMDSITIAIIGLAGTLLAVCISEIFVGKRTLDRLKEHDNFWGKHDDKLVQQGKETKSEHESLLRESTKEHDNLSAEHKLILERQAATNTSLSGTAKEIQTEVRKIHEIARDEKIEQRNRYERLTDHQKAISDSVQNLSTLSAEMERLNSRNQELSEENRQLTRQVQQLTADCRDLKRDYTDLSDQSRRTVNDLQKKVEELQRPRRNREQGFDR